MPKFELELNLDESVVLLGLVTGHIMRMMGTNPDPNHMKVLEKLQEKLVLTIGTGLPPKEETNGDGERTA